MTRSYGRALKGQRVYEAKHLRPPSGEKFTLIATLGLTGIKAPLEIQGSLNGSCFFTYVKDILLPELERGQVVVLDNLSCHKVSGIKELFEQAGVELKYLPSYSPDLSAIEEYWSKVKSYLKKVAARTVDDLREGLKIALDRISVSDIQGWFKHAGVNIQHFVETL